MKGSRKKKIVIAFYVFLGFMWLCTVISKAVYASRLPIVSTESIGQKYVEHIVEVDGIVIAGDKIPVTALGGLRVEKLMVQTGDRVEEGDVIFTVDMDDLDDMMEEKQRAISRLQVQIDTLVYNEELARQKREREEQRAREDYDTIARSQDTLVGRATNEVSKIEDKMSEQNGGETNEDLLEALQQAAYAEADAKGRRDDAIKEAGRRVEDITAPDSQDATLEVSRLELAGLQEELACFQEIKDGEGRIYAKQGGLITDIYINTGGRTSDSALMLLADDNVPCRFKAVLTQEQKKYVGLNDTISLKLDGSGKEQELIVNYVAESGSASGSYEVYVDLPEGVGMPGLSGTMRHSEQGERHACCVTPGTVHAEGIRNYVYVVKERQGILGKEYYAEQINVKVLDENDSFVAVEGALDSESLIISSSTKEVKNGDVVRLEE
ncbi:MAG: biotin/lipoyl-binding protein [Lachnospiraceae bacterium]|nr:biotin/lipoyl-binding protein [Lachnospiraceae bacterium]